MTVTQLRELLSKCDPDDTVEIHFLMSDTDRYLVVQGLSSDENAGVTFLDGGKY